MIVKIKNDLVQFSMSDVRFYVYVAGWMMFLDAQVFLIFPPFGVISMYFSFPLVVFLNLSLLYRTNAHISQSENSDINLFTILCESSTIPKDCNYICYKYAAYIQPMHQSLISSCIYFAITLFDCDICITWLLLLVQIGT